MAVAVRMLWVAAVLAFCTPFSVVAQCGVMPAMTKIVGGEPVTHLKYPWFVALVPPIASPTLSVSCGGSLITSRHVLTAAHCFPATLGLRPEELYRVVFQLVDRCRQPDADDSAIERVDIYPAYNSRTLQGDVAILTLEKTVPYMPVCLPPKNYMPVGEAVIIGFGSTLAKSQYPCTLQEARVTIFTKQQCARSGLALEFSRVPGTICAGVLRGGIDSCDGDSGGPLLTQGPDGLYIIQGIVSFGEGCARRGLPGVYTHVSNYIDFINDISSSSSGGSAPAAGDSDSHGDRPHRPPGPLHNILQGLFKPFHHRTGWHPPHRVKLA